MEYFLCKTPALFTGVFVWMISKSLCITFKTTTTNVTEQLISSVWYIPFHKQHNSGL